MLPTRSLRTIATHLGGPDGAELPAAPKAADDIASFSEVYTPQSDGILGKLLGEFTLGTRAESAPKLVTVEDLPTPRPATTQELGNFCLSCTGCQFCP